GGRADRAQARRPGALRADQRHDDGAPDPSAWAVERARKRAWRVPPVQAHDQRQAGREAELSGQRRHAGPLGLSLPSPLPHGDGHVPGGARAMSALRISLLAAALAVLAIAAAAQTPSAPNQPQMPGMVAGGAMQPVMDQSIYAHL